MELKMSMFWFSKKEEEVIKNLLESKIDFMQYMVSSCPINSFRSKTIYKKQLKTLQNLYKKNFGVLKK